VNSHYLIVVMICAAGVWLFYIMTVIALLVAITTHYVT